MATADTFVGKKVVDREGIKYGKVRHVHINQETFKVQGVTVRKGIGKKYYVAEQDIDRFTEESLLLSKPPVTTGTKVTDIDGHKVGRIKRVHRDSDTGEVESIEVSCGVLKTKIISRSDIWGVGERVTLKMTKPEFKALE